MKLTNKSTRPYGINGKIIAPNCEVTIEDKQLPDVQMFIDSGDLVIVKEEVKEVSEVKEEKKKAGRPAKTEE